MDHLLLEDPAAVAAMVAGNPAGLESMYRRYADRLYAYAKSIVGDADTAADVIQETFLLAQERVRQLRDPQRVSAWLYAIARNECLAKLRARKRTVMLAESHEPVLDTDPGRAVHAQQVRELVHAASAGMNDGDREVFELTVRHGMAASDVARVLDISEKHAHARISRVRSQFEGALGALVLARAGRGRCEQLDAILLNWDGQLTALLRKRIERHARECDTCSQRRRERMNPAGLLASYAALPFLAVAAELWPRLQVASSAAASAAPAGAAAPSPAGPPGPAGAPPAGPPMPAAAGPPGLPTAQAGAGPGGPVAQAGAGPGGPVAATTGPSGTLVMPAVAGGPPPPPRRSNAGLVLGAAAAILLIVLGVSAVRLLTLDTPTTVAAPPGESASSGSSGTPSPTSTGQPTTTEPTTAQPTTGQPPSAAPPPPTTTASGPFEATVTAQSLCPQRALRITAEATAPLATARVHWVPTATAEMVISGSTAQITLDDELPSASTILWRVELRAVDGRTYATDPAPATVFC